MLFFYFTRSKWLFQESTAMYPSLYLKYENMTAEKRARFMEGRMEESSRVMKMTSLRNRIYSYTWLKYYDTKQFIDKVCIIS